MAVDISIYCPEIEMYSGCARVTVSITEYPVTEKQELVLTLTRGGVKLRVAFEAKS